MHLARLYGPCNSTPALLYVTGEIGNRQREIDGTSWFTACQMKDRWTDREKGESYRGVISNCLQRACGGHQIRMPKCQSRLTSTLLLCC